MNHDSSLISAGLLIISAVTIVLSLPLIFRMVKMNGVYGVRIPESFRSPERWFQINRFGGVLLLLWGVVVGITGGAGLALESSQWQKFCLISACVVIGGLVLVTISILVYAAKTKKH
jgi:uncharacterized membrane protein